MDSPKEDAPQAVPGLWGGEPGSTSNGCILQLIIDHVKHGIKRLCLRVLEPGQHSHYSRRRSLAIDQLIGSIEVVRG